MLCGLQLGVVPIAWGRCQGSAGVSLSMEMQVSSSSVMLASPSQLSASLACRLLQTAFTLTEASL